MELPAGHMLATAPPVQPVSSISNVTSAHDVHVTGWGIKNNNLLITCVENEKRPTSSLPGKNAFAL